MNDVRQVMFMPVNVSSEKKEAPKADVKKVEIDPEGAAKIAGAMTGLALSGLAAVALIKKGKGKKVAAEVAETAKENVQKLIPEVVETAKENVQKLIPEQAKEMISNGASVGSVKKQVTKNLPHNAKKAARETLSEGLDIKLAKEAAEKQKIIQDTTIAKSVPSNVKSMAQGVKKNASDVEVLEQKITQAHQLKTQAKEAADEMQKIAKANSTSRNRRMAQYAHNQAEKARVNADVVEETAIKAFVKADDAAKVKADNIAKMQASPNYQKGEATKQANAVVTTQRAIDRAISKDKAKPAYNNMMSLLNSHVKAGRTDVAESIAKKALNSNKKLEVMAAQDFLASLIQ